MWQTAGVPAAADEATTRTPPLPAPPPAALDDFLDAAARCFLRYGVRRTSVQDIADEIGVNRTTVYRQVGNVESILKLLTAREVHRHVGEAYRRADFRAVTPQAIVKLLAEMIVVVRAHPVMAKLLTDERDFLRTVLDDMPATFARIAAAIVPALDEAMATGRIARRDPRILAEWLARISASTILAPPPGDLEAFLAEVLVPVLEPM